MSWGLSGLVAGDDFLESEGEESGAGLARLITVTVERGGGVGAAASFWDACAYLRTWLAKNSNAEGVATLGAVS